MTSDAADRYNTRALDIWAEYCTGARSSVATYAWAKRRPAVVDALRSAPQVLFVGFNPSFDAAWMAAAYQARGWAWQDGADFAWPSQGAPGCLERVKSFEAHCRTSHDYFVAHAGVAQRVGAPEVEHLDLFLMRERSQNHVLPALEARANAPYLAARQAFIDAQFQLFFETVRTLGPTIVAVTNGTASRRLRERFVFQSADDGRSYRTHEAPASVFVFAGMVHAAHQMDTPSRERFEADLRLLLGTSAFTLVPRLAQAA